MADYILTNKAVEDLSKIWDYTYEVWSEKGADNYYYMLLEHCRKLADNPGLGKIYEEINNDIFGFRVSHHIIFYKKIKENSIAIVRVLHGRMDLKSRMQE